MLAELNGIKLNNQLNMKTEIVSMYLEDLQGKGDNTLYLVAANGDEFAASVHVHNTWEDVVFNRVRSN